MPIFKPLDRLLAQLIISLIKLYQKTLSPDHSLRGKLFPYRGCKFHPTCSVYGIACFKQRGFVKGLGPTLKRFAKCHPWSEGGVDLPPNL